MSAPEIHARGTIRKTLHIWGPQRTAEERQHVAAWLTDNGIDPKRVERGPITLEFVPGCPGSVTGCSGTSVAPWWISFTEYYTNGEGNRELNALLGSAAATHRTVPLTVEPTDDVAPGWSGERGNLVSHAELAKEDSR